MMTVGALALKDEAMRPEAPFLSFVHVSLGAADQTVDTEGAAGEADTAGGGILPEEVLIGQAIDRSEGIDPDVL